MDTQLASPALTAVVACYESLDRLPCMLWSLKVQTYADIEVIITDNSLKPEINARNLLTVQSLCDPRFRYVRTGLPHCYYSAEEGLRLARGEYVCFPNDDEYYTLGFAEIMLRTAIREEPRADLVYCDCLFDPKWSQGYCRINESQECAPVRGTWVHYAVEPTVGTISKGGFIVRRELALKVLFPGKACGIGSDGFFVYECKRAGAVMRKAPGVLWVHS